MALPSSPEDFAFFQAQSARANPLPAPDASVATDDAAAPTTGRGKLRGTPTRCWCRSPGRTTSKATRQRRTTRKQHAADGAHGADRSAAEDTGVIGDDDADVGAGWGETVGRGQEALPAFKATAIEDTTTVQAVTQEIDRAPATEDLTFSVKGERPLETSITEYGFTADDAKKAGEAAKTLLGLTTLGDRYVVGLRGYRPDPKQPGYKLVQLSINAPDKYIGTIALADSGEFVVGADPWLDDDLSQYSQDSAAEPQGAELPAARRDLQHRHPQRRSERGHRRGDHAGVEGLRPAGAGDQGRQADHRLRQVGERRPGQCRPRALCRDQGRRPQFRVLRLSAGARRRLRLHDREGRHPQRRRDQRHGAARQRRADLDLRLPQASDPRRGAAAQGRRLEGAGRHADHGGVRRHHRLYRRRQGLRQRHPHRPRQRHAPPPMRI